jgi:hypothetical protein
LEIRVSEMFCPGWPLTSILPISASQVARISDVSHQCMAHFWFCFNNIGNSVSISVLFKTWGYTLFLSYKMNLVIPSSISWFCIVYLLYSCYI